MGSSSMSNQIMIGFFAWAESVDIRVDERELAGWGGLGLLLEPPERGWARCTCCCDRFMHSSTLEGVGAHSHLIGWLVD